MDEAGQGTGCFSAFSSEPGAPEGAAEPPLAGLPQGSRVSFDFGVSACKRADPTGIRLDPKLLRKNADNPRAPSSSPLCSLSSFAGPGNVAAPRPHLPIGALKICCTKRKG